MELILLFILFFLTFIHLGSPSFGKVKKGGAFSNYRQLEKLISQRKQYHYHLIDLRPQEEYRRAHIPSARNIPLKELSRYLPTDQLFTHFIVYGKTSSQAQKGVAILERTGYFNVSNFGSFSHWKGKVETGEYQEQREEERQPGNLLLPKH